MYAGACGNQKESAPLELELFQVKSHMGAGSQTWVVYKPSKRSQLMSHLDRLKEKTVIEEAN